MNTSLKTLALSVLAASSLASGAAFAELSGNIGVTSNYMWRGVTQTGDGPAVSGGLDFAHESGIYAGVWTSNAAWTSPSSYELDAYAGYAGEAAGIGYDVGYVSYMYPNATDNDFAEVYLGASYEMVSAKISYDSENKNMYAEAGVDFELGQGFGLGLHFGSYNFDAGTDYTDYAVTISKEDFSFAFSNTSDNVALGQTDNYRVAASWSKSF